MRNRSKKLSLNGKGFRLLVSFVRNHLEQLICLATAEVIEQMLQKNRSTRKIGWLTYRLVRKKGKDGEEMYLSIKVNKISPDNLNEAKLNILETYRKMETSGYTEETRIAFYEAVKIKKY